MFIIKFNNMVKNKWLWGAFAVVVAVAFGASDILSAGPRRGGEGALGTLGGKPLDPALHQTVGHLIRYRNLLSGATDAPTAREQWKLAAALLRAREAGFSVSDAELAGIIREMPFLRGRDGAFSREAYENALRVFEFTPQMFQEAVRADVALNQLRHYVSRGPWAPPSVVEDRTLGRSDVFTLQAATLSNAFTAAAAEVAPEEARAFYDAHPELYRLPERRAVRYVAFPAVAYREKAALSEEELRAWYDDNESDYETADTNGVAVVRPFEEVRGEIADALAPLRQSEMAATDAGDFADLFLDGGYGAAPAPDFAAAAAARGFGVVTTALFAADAAPVTPDAASAFCADVFALELGGDASMRTTGVVGEDGAKEFFVAELLEVSDAHVPPYGEIEDRVLADAKADKAARDFQDRVTKAQEALVRGLEEGRAFAELAAENGLAAGTNFIFSSRDAFGGAAPVEQPARVAAAMMQLGAGDLCPAPIETPTGALFFQVLARAPGDASLAEGYRGQIEYGYAEQTADALWDAWLENNFLAMDPHPRTPFEGDAAAEEEEGDGASAPAPEEPAPEAAE